ncbi:MAG: winged helix-turn-helix transcriptional regulator [Alphaproteobacteria bacterium]|nr:winged helix-turn-helix transcriptional regulator [Alphaproteobacteria bacterium]
MKDFSGIINATDLMKTLANPNRLKILCLIGDQEVSVSEMLEHLPISQSALSQHLAGMRELDLVQTRRDQQCIFYKLKNPTLKGIIDILHREFCKK